MFMKNRDLVAGETGRLEGGSDALPRLEAEYRVRVGPWSPPKPTVNPRNGSFGPEDPGS
jgi:hypothetical protein